MGEEHRFNLINWVAHARNVSNAIGARINNKHPLASNNEYAGARRIGRWHRSACAAKRKMQAVVEFSEGIGRHARCHAFFENQFAQSRGHAASKCEKK